VLLVTENILAKSLSVTPILASSKENAYSQASLNPDFSGSSTAGIYLYPSMLCFLHKATMYLKVKHASDGIPVQNFTESLLVRTSSITIPHRFLNLSSSFSCLNFELS